MGIFAHTKMLEPKQPKRQTPNEFLNHILGSRIVSAGDRIKTHRDMRRVIAKQCGIDLRTLERFLSGQIDIRSQAIFSLMSALKLNPEEIAKLITLYNDQPSAKHSLVPKQRKPPQKLVIRTPPHQKK